MVRKMKLKAEKRFSVDPRGFFCFIDTSDFDVANAQYSNIAFVTTIDLIIGCDKFQSRIFDVLEILSPYVLSLNCAISYEASQLRTLVSISFHHFEMNTPRINLIFSRRLIMSLVDGER